jgi:hypothetical protein
VLDADWELRQGHSRRAAELLAADADAGAAGPQGWGTPGAGSISMCATASLQVVRQMVARGLRRPEEYSRSCRFFPFERNISCREMLSTAMREGATERHASPLVRTRAHDDGRNCNRRRDFRTSGNEGRFACDVRRPLIRLRAAQVDLSDFGQFAFPMSLLGASGVGVAEPWRPPGTRSGPQHTGQGPPGLPPVSRRGPFLSRQHS